MRRLVVIAGALLGLAGLAAGAWLGLALTATGPPHEVRVEIEAGRSVTGILAELKRVGVVPSPLAGRLYLALRAGDRTPRFGHYRFAPRIPPWQVLEQVLDGRVDMLTVTVVEGQTAADVAAAFQKQGVGSEWQWRQLVTDPSPVVHLDPAATSLEGYLYPDTYRFAVGIPPETVVDHLVARFESEWTRLVQQDPEPWGTVRDVVTLASMVEAETGVAAERARVAGVFVNRLRRGMLLQCDPTVVFALKRQGRWTGRLLRIHWQVDDPYNTYRYPGLPPGPINSPGAAALGAALEPESHRYLYFVARPEGGHHFSTTLAEHNRAVARWRRFRR